MDVKLIIDNLDKLLDILSDVEMDPEDREVAEFLIREIEKEVRGE